MVVEFLVLVDVVEHTGQEDGVDVSAEQKTKSGNHVILCRFVSFDC